MGTTKMASRPGTSRRPTSNTQIQFSIFRHAKDSAAIPQVGTAEQIMAELAVNRTPTPGNPGGDSKRSMPAISGASYLPGGTRGYENALEVGLLILDIDNSIDEPTGENHVDSRTGKPTGRPKTQKAQIPDPVGFDAVAAHLRSTGVAFTMWTTWSSRPEWQKFRVVIFLAQAVPVVLWARASEHALTLLGLDQFKRGLDIPVLHNGTRQAL